MARLAQRHVERLRHQRRGGGLQRGAVVGAPGVAQVLLHARRRDHADDLLHALVRAGRRPQHDGLVEHQRRGVGGHRELGHRQHEGLAGRRVLGVAQVRHGGGGGQGQRAPFEFEGVEARQRVMVRLDHLVGAALHRGLLAAARAADDGRVRGDAHQQADEAEAARRIEHRARPEAGVVHVDQAVERHRVVGQRGQRPGRQRLAVAGRARGGGNGAGRDGGGGDHRACRHRGDRRRRLERLGGRGRDEREREHARGARADGGARHGANGVFRRSLACSMAWK